MIKVDEIIPLEKYDFLKDYDDDFFSKEYPRMWRIVCAYVEREFAKIGDGEVEHLKELQLQLGHKEGAKAFNEIMQLKKKNRAMQMMDEQLKEHEKLLFKWDTFILTEEEKKEIEKAIKREISDMYVTVIDKHGLYARIDAKEGITTFQYKDGPRYFINNKMNSNYRRYLTDREKEILGNCAEVGLHYKWIARIFGTQERFTDSLCKKLGYTNVFATPQELIKKTPVVKAIDHDGFFVIERENPMFKNKISKE